MRIKAQIRCISDVQALEGAYAHIPGVDLSQDVLARCREMLTVLP